MRLSSIAKPASVHLPPALSHVSQERSAVEADFACGRVRVVAATVAFGMGINLARVGAVVHAWLPRSLEEYVQQVRLGPRTEVAWSVLV